MKILKQIFLTGAEIIVKTIEFLWITWWAVAALLVSIFGIYQFFSTFENKYLLGFLFLVLSGWAIHNEWSQHNEKMTKK